MLSNTFNIGNADELRVKIWDILNSNEGINNARQVFWIRFITLASTILLENIYKKSLSFFDDQINLEYIKTDYITDKHDT